MKNEKNYIIQRTEDPTIAPEINKINQDLLLTSNQYSLNNEETNEKLDQFGFVIGNHQNIVLQNWIQNPQNQIFIALESPNQETQKIVGFVLVIKTTEIIQEVQNYGKEVNFFNEEVKKNFTGQDFAYLLQVGVKPAYQKQGIGSLLMKSLQKEFDIPIISFVMISPLINRPSVYLHLKNGFLHRGNYYGEYGGFPNYKSACLIWYPNHKNPSKTIIQQRYRNLLENITY